MYIEENKIIIFDDIIKIMEDVNSAVMAELTKTVSKYSRGRVLYGAAVQHESLLQTIKIIQADLLEQLASKAHMA